MIDTFIVSYWSKKHTKERAEELELTSVHAASDLDDASIPPRGDSQDQEDIKQEGETPDHIHTTHRDVNDHDRSMDHDDNSELAQSELRQRNNAAPRLHLSLSENSSHALLQSSSV